MNTTIRNMIEQDRHEVLAMMRTFYASPAVFTEGSDEIFTHDIDQCLKENPYLEGYVITDGDTVKGYAMIAKSFSTEFGKPCVWIEDLYIKEAYRGQGAGRSFMDFIMDKYTDCVFRLEAEEDNETAVNLYRKQGFTVMPYMEMKK